ncbi:MAG: hypothetical protein IT267_06035 [Saprospiraceae bacterium]|nr:hypothetical protein [Saprospiraceae bacterium]
MKEIHIFSTISGSEIILLSKIIGVELKCIYYRKSIPFSNFISNCLPPEIYLEFWEHDKLFKINNYYPLFDRYIYWQQIQITEVDVLPNTSFEKIAFENFTIQKIQLYTKHDSIEIDAEDELSKISDFILSEFNLAMWVGNFGMTTDAMFVCIDNHGRKLIFLCGDEADQSVIFSDDSDFINNTIGNTDGGYLTGHFKYCLRKVLM